MSNTISQNSFQTTYNALLNQMFSSTQSQPSSSSSFAQGWQMQMGAMAGTLGEYNQMYSDLSSSFESTASVVLGGINQSAQSVNSSILNIQNQLNPNMNGGSASTSSVSNAIQSFVTAYNNMQTSMTNNSQYFNQFNAQELQMETNLNIPSNLGITQNKDGTMTFDATQFANSQGGSTTLSSGTVSQLQSYMAGVGASVDNIRTAPLQKVAAPNAYAQDQQKIQALGTQYGKLMNYVMVGQQMSVLMNAHH